jgi:dihydrofolate synthase/folylpolyglutamate synthase
VSGELQYLDSLLGSGIRPGLERVRALLAAAGHPERSYRSVLVAGTNGKGSTAATLASILRASGRRTALYISPHLVNLNERWVIDGRSIDDALLADSIRALRTAAAKCRFAPTYFEALTVIAFIAFAKAECEIAVLETGMGGRLDATNVVRPVLSVISRIGIDHTEYLGTTLRAIAREKAGIIHRSGPAVTSNDHPAVLDVLRRRAKQIGSSLHEIGIETEATRLKVAQSGTSFHLRTPDRTYRIASPLAGEHQVENVALAVRAAEIVQEAVGAIGRVAVERGVRDTRWRGRMERFTIGGRVVFVDGAHNIQAAETVARFVEKHIPRPRTLVFGIMQDKEPEDVAKIFLPMFDTLVLTEPPDPRATPVRTLERIAMAAGQAAVSRRRPRDAFRFAVEETDGTVLIAGSLYLAGEAIAFLDRINAATADRRSAPEAKAQTATAVRRRPKVTVTTR